MNLFVPMFTLGLITSLHCVSMCGPMVVGYALKGTEGKSLAHKVVPNLAYQGAKIVSYMLVGLALGAIGAAFNLDSIRPYVMVVAGVFMVVLGLGMTGRFPWAAKLTPRPPKFLMTALSKTRRSANTRAAAGESSLATPVTLGMLTGLFPCAPLMGAQITAAASGSPITGALAMLAFGLGTAPLMLGFGTASSLIPSVLKERVMVALAVVVIVLGGVYVNRAAMLLGSPVTAQSIKQYVVGTPSAAQPIANYETAADGVIEVPLVIENVQFVPSQLSLPADRPVRLIVDRREENACSDQLAIPQMGILVDLKPFATTTIDLPATASGTYTLTCGMGMMAGRIVVGSGAAIAGGSSLLPTLVVMLGLAGGGVYWTSRRRAATAGTSRSASGAQRAAAVAPATALGFSPQELIVVAGAVAAAALIGLAMGGYFG